MKLTVIDPSEKGQRLKWDLFVQRQYLASGYHLMAWRDVIEQAFGHKTVYLMAVDQINEVQGILPLVLLSSRPFGRFFVSLPCFTYGGILADSKPAQEQLLEAAIAMAQRDNVQHIELRHQAAPALDWPYKTHKVSMRLGLPRDCESLWKAFPPKLRSQIRRPMKEGMTTVIGGVEKLEAFYEVFVRGMRDLGTPVYSKQFFSKILETFPKEAQICVVEWNRQTLAAGLLYGFRKVLEIPWAVSDRRFARMAPNMLLYSAALEFACREGYEIFDFGRSSVGSGTYRFKEQWGAKPVQLYWHYWLRSEQPLPELNPQNPKYRLAIEIWKRLPLPLTTMLGPRISKYLP